MTARLFRQTFDFGPLFLENRKLGGVFWGCLVLYVLVLPIASTIALRNVTFVLLLSLAVWKLVEQRRWPAMPLWKPWLAYAGVALASLTYALAPAYTFHEVKVEILVPCLTFWLAANTIRSESTFRQLSAIICIGNAFMVTFSLTTAAIGGTTKDGMIGTLNTGVGNYSTCLVSTLPVIVLLLADAWRHRRLVAFGLGLLVAANLTSLVLTHNRQALVSLAIEIAVAGFLIARHHASRRSLLISLVAVLLLGTLFVKQYEFRDQIAQQGQIGTAMQSDVRWHLWEFTVDRIVERPWSGGGFGLRAFRLQYPDFEPNSLLWHAHNMVLNKGAQMGVPGIIAFLLLYMAVPLTLMKGLQGPPAARPVIIAGLAMTVGVFLKNMTDDFFIRENGYLFWLLAGAAIGTGRSATASAGGRP